MLDLPLPTRRNDPPERRKETALAALALFPTQIAQSGRTDPLRKAPSKAAVERSWSSTERDVTSSAWPRPVESAAA